MCSGKTLKFTGTAVNWGLEFTIEAQVCNVHNRNVKIISWSSLSLFKGKLRITAILLHKRKGSLKILKSPENPQRFLKWKVARRYKYIKSFVLDMES
jgi:hypothetical protein